MAKHKKHGGGARKPILPSRSSQGRPASEASAQARERGRELAGLTPDQFKQRLERNLLGSIALRDEPEFADFRFDDEEVVEVTVRHLKRYEARLNALLNRGDREAGRELYDMMRIDIIADLVTPEVRRDLQERIRRCRERLKQGREADKLEMTLYVDLLLSGQDKVIPLGVCGLLTAIYEDSHRQALEDFQAQQALRDELADVLPLRETSDATQLLALAAQPEVVAQVTKSLEAHPDQRTRLERDMDRMIAEVSRAIRSGQVPATFFTDEEVLRTYADAYHSLGGALDRRNPPDGRALAESFLKLMQRNLVELITPDRNIQFRRYLEDIGHELARSGDRKRQKLGLQLALAAGTLDTWELGKHPFLYEVYLAQAKQMQEHGLTSASSSEREAIFERLVAERRQSGS
jgi:hypothetical protein